MYCECERGEECASREDCADLLKTYIDKTKMEVGRKSMIRLTY